MLVSLRALKPFHTSVSKFFFFGILLLSCYNFTMNYLQTGFLIFVALYSVLCFSWGFRNTYIKKNPFGLTPLFNPLGAFVWADTIMFGVFFFLVSLVSFLLSNINLFFLVYSVFWVIRSLGEQIYWFLEQFTHTHRNKPETLSGHKIFPGESIYIHYQIFWQCITVISIISSVYFFIQVFN